MSLEELKGRVISSIALTRDGSYIRFDTDTGSLYYYAEGDCCSTSWIAEIAGADNVIAGGVIEEVVDVDMPLLDSHREHSIYAVRIRAYRGEAILIFRNESNGYYGGWLQPIEPERVSIFSGPFAPIDREFRATGSG